jgi:hypothetical protein
LKLSPYQAGFGRNIGMPSALDQRNQIQDDEDNQGERFYPKRRNIL